MSRVWGWEIMDERRPKECRIKINDRTEHCDLAQAGRLYHYTESRY